MVGLSVVLDEAEKCGTLHKATFFKMKLGLPPPPPPPPPSPPADLHKHFPAAYEQEKQQAMFLQQYCCFCHHKLLPGKDIYMYKGDKGFCSLECRFKQMLMDDDDDDDGGEE